MSLYSRKFEDIINGKIDSNHKIIPSNTFDPRSIIGGKVIYVANHRLIIFGEQGSVVEVNLKTGVFTLLGDLPQHKSEYTVHHDLCDNFIYVLGGFKPYTYLRSCHKLDLKTKTWY